MASIVDFMVAPDSDKYSFGYDAVHIEPHRQIAKHSHHYWELSCIIVGRGVRTVGDVTETFDEQECVLLPPDIPHRWSFNRQAVDSEGKIRNISLSFNSSLLERCADTFAELAEPFQRLATLDHAIKLSGSAARKVRRIMQSMESADDAERMTLVLQALSVTAQENNTRAVGSHKTTDAARERMDKINTYIICNMHRHITIADVAAHIGVNRSAFCVFFRRTAADTFVHYLNRLRIEQACQLLRTGGLSVSDVCYRTGFNNLSYFNRIFKALIGTAPSRYTSNHK